MFTSRRAQSESEQSARAVLFESCIDLTSRPTESESESESEREREREGIRLPVHRVTATNATIL